MSPRRAVAAWAIPEAVYALCAGGWAALAVGMPGLSYIPLETALDAVAFRRWWLEEWRERVLAEAARRSAPRPLWVEVEDEQ